MSNDKAIDFKFDVEKSYIDQIQQYVAQIGKTLDSHDLSLEQSKQLVHFLVTDIDFGAHSHNSENHLNDIYFNLAEHILNSISRIKDRITEAEYPDLAERNKRTLWMSFRLYYYTCKYCGTKFLTKYSKGSLSFCNEVVQLGFSTYTPPSKDECYKKETVRLKFTAKSDKMVFASDLQNFLKDQTIAFDRKKYNINTPYGRIKAAQDFEAKGVLCLSAANTAIVLFENKNDLVITNGYHSDIEEYAYAEEIKAESRLINKTIHKEGYEFKKEISCSIGWLMAASVDDVDMEKLETDRYQDSYILNVEKGAEYIIEFDSEQSYFEYYKFVKN